MTARASAALMRVSAVLFAAAALAAVGMFVVSWSSGESFVESQISLEDELDLRAVQWRDAEAPQIAEGEALARLDVPALDLSVVTLAGVQPNHLQQAVGWSPESDFSGGGGNVAFAGHRSGWGSPFEDLDLLSEGDEIIVSWATGAQAVYLVDSTEIVDPSAVEHMRSEPKRDGETISLITCHPKGSYDKRMIVTGTLQRLTTNETHEALLSTAGDGHAVTEIPLLVDESSASDREWALIPALLGAAAVLGVAGWWSNNRRRRSAFGLVAGIVLYVSSLVTYIGL